MKKIAFIMAVLVFSAVLASCTAEKQYENFEELNNGSSIKLVDKTYTFYNALSKDSLRGAQIGIVDGDSKHKIFEVKGYSSDEWLIEYYDVIMSVYSLYKADTVKEIPDELVV